MNRCILSFIDILGFAAEVESIGNSEVKFKKVKRSVRAFVSNLASDSEESVVSVLNFSDCVVRARLVRESEDVRHILREEIERLSSCQLWCLQDGFAIRGGVSVGSHFQGRIKPRGFSSVHCIISPALIRAFRLESKHAKYPRIVLSEDTVAANGLTDYEYLVHDKRDHLFSIDYLWACYLKNAELDHRNFSDSKTLITQGLTSQSARVRAKYLWLKRYHNRTLKAVMENAWKELGEEGESRRSFISSARQFMAFI